MAEKFKCSICSSKSLYLRSEYSPSSKRWIWHVTCRNGHYILAAPGFEIGIDVKEDDGL